jgi:hypothetical protein
MTASKSMPDVQEKQSSTPGDSSIADVSMSPAVPEVMLSKDGFKLFPQPVPGDKLDPLNWSFIQKHVILAIIMAMCVAPWHLYVASQPSLMLTWT